MRIVAALLLTLIALPGSGAEGARRRAVGRPSAWTVVIHDDFRNGQLGWQSGFADYSPVNEAMELEAALRPLPPELSVTGTGFYITGHNRSDDLFMFLAKKLTTWDGIQPGQRYEVSFDLLFASNAASDCLGVGGSPGASVYLKAGAASAEPRVFLDETNHYRITTDKGNQSESGREMSVAGTIANGSPDCRADAPFITLHREHHHPLPVTASSAGEIWLIVGTDSAFEGKTELYYQVISATLTPVP